ncbi:serine palmitoyltransferase 1 [Diabrotica virgifera virgifera]|uniref:Serine palmitoyltransferase 1 n=1 Tax=Diabrotica virgifera virgifera TaxID=50390 RepID=A0A6P7FYW2_DIAVI|nr:serine palmitoyltransferase 1 [Diabrotica virgifera virgifera]
MLDENLLQERLAQFNPEPLVDITHNKPKESIESYTIQEDENNIDLAKTNFLNFLDNEEIKKSAENIIRKYGVGTCGPRAFYGTTDVHLDLEQRLADFLNMSDSIVYSYGFVAISSSIAAYCKRSDTVFLDKETNFPILQGVIASKSKIVYFDHNDPNSLRREVEKVIKNEKKPSRKFLIVEGVSWKTGKLLPLEEFLKVAEDYKIRIFLEESYSIGIYGDHGKGLTEHFNIDPSRIDMIIATLEAAFGSIGGFCAGSHLTIEHQRLSGAGYIFSASLPTFLVQACIESIRLMEDRPKQIRAFAREFQVFLEETCQYKVDSDPECAFKVFTVKEENGRKEKEEVIHSYCKQNGVHFLITEGGLMINLSINIFTNKSRLEKVYKVLEDASKL